MPFYSGKSMGKFRRKFTFYFLGLASGILTSIWVILDMIANRRYITNVYLFGAFEMFVGLIVSILLVLVFLIPIPNRKKPKMLIGHLFDPAFKKIQLPKGKQALYTLLAGLFASGNTVLYFILIGKYDASVIMPFSQFVLIYLLAGDTINEREKPVLIEIQSIITITIGVIIASITQDAATFDIQGFLLVIGPFSIFAAFYTYFQKKALATKDQEGNKMDTVNLRLWTLLIMVIIQIAFSLPFISFEDWQELQLNWVFSLPYIISSMLLVYIGVIFYTRALDMGKMSVVKSLNSINVIMTIPLAALAAFWWSDVFQNEFTTISGTILKMVGAILVLTGVIALAMSEVRAVFLAKLQQGEPIELEKLTKMVGIDKVNFVTGRYDLLISIKTRSIGKTYNLIEKNISKLPWIADVTTLQVMKEYN